MTYSLGTIVFLDYPYTTGGKAKRRPALVLLDLGDADIVVARITSQTPRSRFDVTVADWATAGLQLASIVRLDKLLTVENRWSCERLVRFPHRIESRLRPF